MFLKIILIWLAFMIPVSATAGERHCQPKIAPPPKVVIAKPAVPPVLTPPVKPYIPHKPLIF